MTTFKRGTRFTLGTRNEIATALIGVDGDGHRVVHFYPRIMDLAGHDQSATTFALFLTMEAGAYLDIPRFQAYDQRAAATTAMHDLIHRFGRALIKDPATLEEFLDVLARVGLPTGR